MGTEAPQGDMPFAEWSEKLEATTNHWLPAYGFQQPSQLQEALLSHDYINTDGLNQQSYVYLATIVEETSDDLRSDSEYSEIAGWPDTDSEAGSVIHIPNTINHSNCNSGDWSGGSERDLAVPKKRRRRLFNNDPGVNDDDDDDDNFLLPPETSRSSSLLQFEQLEKQCDTVFRTSVSVESFVSSSKLVQSLSFDSLETARRQLSGSADSLNEASSLSSSCSSSSELISSDDEEDVKNRSLSSRTIVTADNFKSSLTSHRSFDSLVMCQEKFEIRDNFGSEFSQSLTDTVTIDEDTDDEPIVPPRGLYKTVECLTESVYEEIVRENPEPVVETRKERVRGQRSAENLSEDSGFGEHVPRAGSLRRASSSGVFTIAERDDNDDDDDDSSSFGSAENTDERVKIERSGGGGDDERRWDDVETNFNPGWQSAPNLFKLETNQFENGERVERVEVQRSEEELDKRIVNFATVPGPITSTTSLLSFAIKDDDEFLIIPESKSFKLSEMNSRHPVVSTPNLYCEEGKTYELNFPTVSVNSELSRALSLKNTNATSNSNPNLRKTRSRGSNIQITTSFINLTDSKSSIGGGSGKGVHFSPVVSEVSWRESDRDDWSDEVDLDGEEKWKLREEERERKWEVVKEREKGDGRLQQDLLRPNESPPPPPTRPPPQLPSRPLSALREPAGSGTSTAVIAPAPTLRTGAVPVVNGVSMESHPKSKTGLGGFFQRFSLRRLSGRDKKRKDFKKDPSNRVPAPIPVQTVPTKPDDVIIIPLHPPEEEKSSFGPSALGRSVRETQPAPICRERMRAQPPPPPPRGGSVMSSASRVGLLETDLDSPDVSPSTKKARSLLNLGGPARAQLSTCDSNGSDVVVASVAAAGAENRAKSMEFLLDKENQFAAKPPENELQKVGERVMSEHELRVQRSLQKLNVPDWYKTSTVPSQGFLLKRHSEGGGGNSAGWQGLTSKTTSLSSLGSLHHATPRSPTSNLLSPSPTPSGHTFSRWSTSRLNSNPNSASTSPSGSIRSSFNYRQPYLGWRSQERLTNPRTPAERLAAGILSQQPKQQPTVPNMNELSEVHSSIKEVTSAIVHYVSGSRADDRLSPAMGRHYDSSSSRSASPRGSNSRLCWLESSFVGNKPIDVPETPVSLTATPDHGNGHSDLYLDLSSTHRPNVAPINDTV